MNETYRSSLSTNTLLYNIEYHIFKYCNTKEECVEMVRKILKNFEANKNDRKDE